MGENLRISKVKIFFPSQFNEINGINSPFAHFRKFDVKVETGVKTFV